MLDDLTQHFTLKEATVTTTGIANDPESDEVVERLVNTATNMEVVRAILGRNPININSWYRSPAVNKAVGGVPRSEHANGAAVDFTCSRYGTPFEVAQSLLANAHILNYNQLIYEQSWVHISFPPDGVRGKREVLTMKHGTYTKGLIK